MVDYISPAAGLLEGNTRASTAKLDRQAQRGMKTQELLQSSANTAVQERGAMERTEVQGKQAQLLQNLRDQANMALQTMSEQEASKRQEKLLKEQAAIKRQEDYFTMTPNTVAGIKKTINLDFKDLEGQEVNKDVILALIGAKYKTDIAEAIAEAKKLAGSSPENLQKELDKIENDIRVNRDKLFGISIKDLPPEIWGGEPGNFKKLIQTVSAGKFGKLEPAAESQIRLVTGYINTMKSKQERANKIHGQLGSTKTDYTGFGLGDEGTSYKTAEEVRAAFKAGQLDRASAKKILADQFNIK